MYYVTYNNEGFIQHLRNSIEECGNSLYTVVTLFIADILRQEGEFHKWRFDLINNHIYRLPDCDPKYWTLVDGKYIEMTDEEKSVVDNPNSFEISTEELAQNIRNERNIKLSNTDWTQLADSPLSEEDKLNYKTYRQSLRDITLQDNFPLTVIWPNI